MSPFSSGRSEFPLWCWGGFWSMNTRQAPIASESIQLKIRFKMFDRKNGLWMKLCEMLLRFQVMAME